MDMTISTNSDSWCWSLSASLFGKDCNILVDPIAPGYLPREVEATINGYVWQFLLDVPEAHKTHSNDRVTLKGRSRSAWLGAPFLRAETGGNGESAEAVQLAEMALENTGWTIQWGLPNWLVPAGVFTYNSTPIERIIVLVKAVGGCIRTDPMNSVLYTYSKYPVVPWLWPDVYPEYIMPDSSILSISKSDDRNPLYNGIYVSGTLNGILASVKIAGTDGGLQAEMVVDQLISDSEGIAARERAISILSESGPGYNITTESLLMPVNSAIPPVLILPGKFVSISCDGDAKVALSRGLSISCRWSDVLDVKQTLSFEDRQTE
jgi:hypothetical protein